MRHLGKMWIGTMAPLIHQKGVQKLSNTIPESGGKVLDSLDEDPLKDPNLRFGNVRGFSQTNAHFCRWIVQ